MHGKLLRQPEDRPLPVQFGLRPKLLRERNLPTGPADLPDQRGRDPLTPGGAKPFGGQTLRNLAIFADPASLLDPT